MSIKVYSYDCKPPSENVNLLDEQIWLAHRYYNKLVELQRAWKEERNAATLAICPGYKAADDAAKEAEAEVLALIEGIRHENARAKRKRATPAEAARLKEARVKLKAARELRKAERAKEAENEDLHQALARINAVYNGAPVVDSDRKKGGKLKEARALCGVYWGTYLLIEAAVESAVKKSFGMPRFHAWEGDGSIAVQVQGGATWEDVQVVKGRIRNLLQVAGIRQRGKHKCPVVTFRLCVSTDEKHKPIWTTINAYMHRELPEDAVIKSVALVRRRLPPFRMADGKWQPRYAWSIQFTISAPTAERPRSAQVAGVDLGWRLMPSGDLRVAYVAGDDGHHEEFKLPASLLSMLEKSKSLQAIRDRHWNDILEKLADWKAAQPALPEWFTEATKFMTKWRGKGKLARLIEEWQVKRIDHDEEIVATLLAWREHDVHLWQWEAASEKKFQRRRKARFLEFVAELRERYGRIIVEDFDVRKLSKKKKADDNEVDLSKWYMRIASIGGLRSMLVQSGAVRVSAVDTTKRCHACGSIEEWDHAKHLEHTCSQCGLLWDQDYNAAMNLLASGKVVDETPGTARDAQNEGGQNDAPAEGKYLGRFARRKRDRSQREGEAEAG